MSITDKLNRLKQTKDDIKAAIIGKGVEIADDEPFSGYAGKIDNITGNDSKTLCYLIDKRIHKISNTDVLEIGAMAFYSCANLKEADFPKAREIGNQAFNNCYALEKIGLPMARTIGDNAFQNCNSLVSVDFPNVESIGKLAFNNNYALISAKFARVKSMSNDVFNNCSKLETLTIATNTMCSIGTLQLPKIKDIYVPDELVDAYKTAQNWSTYASQIKPLSELPEK